jgi:hypothetical protein
MSEAPKRDPRIGNRTAAALATVLTLLGHLMLGFEQAFAHVAVALITGYSCALGFEWVDAVANKRPAGFQGGGWRKVVDFLVSPHMTSITTSFLIYTNEHLWVLAFTIAMGLGSKYVFRVPGPNGRYIHFFNPSNFGIAMVLFIFPWVSIIPYVFLTGVGPMIDAIVPVVILLLGTRLNLLFTKRIPLILAWCGGFMLQAAVRSVLFDLPFAAGIAPMSGVVFVLFSFYMITDPMTSPSTVRGQIIYGLSIAAAYGLLMAGHVIFTLFYAVLFVTGMRGVVLYVSHLMSQRELGGAALPVPAK